MGNLKVTADDEEPRCSLCDHINKPEKWCMDNCGRSKSWAGYERTKFEEEDG